jgi:poly-gamma-glutamate synthesis protein (capsule biosynthesis protein)
MLLALLGDVMLGRGVGEQIERGMRSPESFWGDTLPVLRRADLVVAGLECAVTTHPVPWTRYPKVFHFKAPPRATAVLQAAGIRLVSLANNHTLDFEVEGLLETLDHLDAAGIAHAGAGRNLAHAQRPAVLEAGGLRVGMIAFTDNEPPWLAGADRPGTNYIEIRPDGTTLRRVEERAAQAHAEGAQFVILSLHWGPNMRLRPPPHFREFARGALERGVDLIHGHSAHIFQGIEVHKGKPILYDTGDFLDDYAVDPELRNDQSLIFLAEIDGQGVQSLRMLPVRLTYAIVHRAVGGDHEAISARMQHLSAELGTRVQRAGSELRVEVRVGTTGAAG